MNDNDPLDFLNTPESDEKSSDTLSFLDEQPRSVQNLLYERDKLNKIRDEYNTDLSRRATRGLLKGVASGATLSATENVPQLSEAEDDVLFGLGRVVGSILPISKIYKYVGVPLVRLAAQSPVYSQGLQSLARMTGFGLTGVAHKGAEKVIKGEIPSVEELAKEGATWAAIDAGTQALGYGLSFTRAVRNIAKRDGVPAKDVLSRLWQATKNFTHDTFKSPENINPQDIEIMSKMASEAEIYGIDVIAPKVHEVEPIKAEMPPPIKSVESPLALVDEVLGKALSETLPNIIHPEPNAESINHETPINISDTKPLPNKTQSPIGTEKRRPNPIGKKQAVARSLILKKLRVAFKDPIRIGKISQHHAAGIHKLWSKVTRLIKDNDIETAAHEIGHNLHTILFGGNATNATQQLNNVNDALKPFLKELKPLAHYEPWGMEGFAEFTRLYVTNPDVARKLAPHFYTEFESRLDAQYPEMKNALLEARDYYESYLEGTPQSRIRAQTSYAKDISKLDNLKESVVKGMDYLKTQFLDDVYPAKKLVAEAFNIPIDSVENLKDELNLYRSLRLLKGAVGKGDVFISHETFDPKTLKKTGESLKSILKELKDEEDLRSFNDFLIARRTLEQVAKGYSVGINFADAVTVVKDLDAKYSALAKRLDTYNDHVLKYAQKSGIISLKTYMQIKNDNLMYTPFSRVMSTEKRSTASGASHRQARKSGSLKKAGSSDSDIISPIESIIKNTYDIIINSEKNLCGQVLAKLAASKKNIGLYVEKVPTPITVKAKISGEQVGTQLAKRLTDTGNLDFIEFVGGKPQLRKELSDILPEVFLRFGATTYPPGENIITVYINGKPLYYEVSPEIYDMWSKGMAPYTADILTRVLRVPARTLRAGAILNPKFWQKNIIRDTWEGYVATKYPTSLIDTLYAPLSMLSTAANKGDLYVLWMKSGGGMSTMQSLDRDTVVKKLDEIREGYKPYHVIKWLRHVSELSEEANRLAEFSRALEVEGQTRLGSEISAFASRDLSIDFAKMGLLTKMLNQIIPFFNATIQGADKFRRILNNPEDRTRFFPRLLAYIALPSLVFAWLNRDDERIREFYDEERDFNFITFVGDKALKIPVPFEMGVLAHGLTQRLFDYAMTRDPEAFAGLMGSIVSAALPSFIPTIANPLIETYANKNFFTGAPIVPREKEELVARYQYKRGTSSTARLLSRGVAYMLGQDTRSKAASPAIIDHFIASWTGGLGRALIAISDRSLEAAGLIDKIPGSDQAITEQLGFDAFTVRYPRANTKSIETFYDMYSDATSRQKSIKHAARSDIDTDEQISYAYERVDKIYDYATLQTAYKAMQACRREINSIYHDTTIDSDTKKMLIDDLYLQEIDFAKHAVDDIKKYRLSQL